MHGMLISEQRFLVCVLAQCSHDDEITQQFTPPVLPGGPYAAVGSDTWRRFCLHTHLIIGQ